MHYKAEIVQTRKKQEFSKAAALLLLSCEIAANLAGAVCVLVLLVMLVAPVVWVVVGSVVKVMSVTSGMQLGQLGVEELRAWAHQKL